MALDTYDFDLPQGQDYHLTFTYTDENDAAVDLSAYTGRCTVRSMNYLDVVQEYLTTDPEMSMDASGVVDIKFDKDDNNTWTIRQARYWVYATAPSGGDTIRLLSGIITLEKGGDASA